MSSLAPRPTPRCLTCDYLLVSLPDPRCPECGRLFDPADPSTVNITGRPFPTYARLLSRPIGLPFFGLTLIAFAWPLWEYRTPYNNFGAPLLGLLLWVAVFALLAARLFVRFVILRVYDRPGSERRIGHLRKWVVAAIWLIYFVTPTDPIMRAAFRLSRPALERFVQAAVANPAMYAGTHTVGLYQVKLDGVPAPGGLRLWAGYAYESFAGFAFCPADPPVDHEGESYEHLDGPWYIYARPFRSQTTTAPAPTTSASPSSATTQP